MSCLASVKSASAAAVSFGSPWGGETQSFAGGGGDGFERSAA